MFFTILSGLIITIFVLLWLGQIETAITISLITLGFLIGVILS